MSIKARDDFRDINRIDIDTEHPDVKCIKEIENFQNIGCFERSFPRLLNSREKIQMIRNSKKISNVFLQNSYASCSCVKISFTDSLL